MTHIILCSKKHEFTRQGSYLNVPKTNVGATFTNLTKQNVICILIKKLLKISNY